MEITSNEVRPFLLPLKSPLVRLIIRHAHQRMYHAEAGICRVEFRKLFWTTGLKSKIRHVIYDCVKCARFNARPIISLMGDLPAPRVKPSAPFTHTELDYAGPFYGRPCDDKPKKGAKKDEEAEEDIEEDSEDVPEDAELIKAYLLVFVCFSTKAVHLEVTINHRLMALQLFIGRRGVPGALYSDNGTRLMGTKRNITEFEALFRQKWGDTSVDKCLLQLGVHWHTIPPEGPHMDGIWESVVKSAKGFLKRQFGNATLTVFMLHTAMCEIETILNSRPLAPLTDDDDELMAITPAMLLTGFKHRLFPVLAGRKPAQLAVSKDPVQRYRYLQ